MFHMEHIPHPTPIPPLSHSTRPTPSVIEFDLLTRMAWVLPCYRSLIAATLRHPVHFFATLMAGQSDG